MFRIATEVTPTQLEQNGQSSGPLADLESNSFSYDIYQYPVAENPNFPDKNHQIVFYINVPQLSNWNKGAQNGPEPVANRTSDATRFGLRQDNGEDAGVGQVANDVLGGLENLVLKNKTVRTNAAISLYIPNTMMFMQNMQYETVSLTEAMGLAGDVAHSISSLMEGNFRAAGAAIATAVGKELPNSITNLVGEGARKAGLAALGIADNPQNFLLFKQIDFRKFQFDFILTPETPQEASVIKQIIYLFRFHSAPEVESGTSGRFFIPPSMFDIDILHNGQRNTNIPLISTCVINSVNVDYGAVGQWSTYYDGFPLQVRLTLDCTETEIITKDRVSQGF